MSHHVAAGNPETRLEHLEHTVSDLALELTKLTVTCHAHAEAIRELKDVSTAKASTQRPQRARRATEAG